MTLRNDPGIIAVIRHAVDREDGNIGRLEIGGCRTRHALRCAIESQDRLSIYHIANKNWLIRRRWLGDIVMTGALIQPSGDTRS